MVDLNDIADGIPSMGGRKLGPLLRRLACDAPNGTSIVEVGCWLGAGTAQLALGIKDRERPGEVSLHCFDRWRAQRSEVEKAAQKARLRFTVSENTLPHVRRTLEPFEVPIQFHQGDILGSVATFGITCESPLGGPRYTANPNTLWISRV